MPTKPERKVALVTGALTGIGRAAAIAFAQEGDTGGDCSCDRFCGFGKCVVHDWRLDPGGWRDDRGLILGRRHCTR
jgi:hypothetical protein